MNSTLKYWLDRKENRRLKLPEKVSSYETNSSLFEEINCFIYLHLHGSLWAHPSGLQGSDKLTSQVKSQWCLCSLSWVSSQEINWRYRKVKIRIVNGCIYPPLSPGFLWASQWWWYMDFFQMLGYFLSFGV